MAPQSLQNAAPGAKSAKFVNVNPLEPFLRPLGDNDDKDIQELSRNVNHRLQMTAQVPSGQTPTAITPARPPNAANQSVPVNYPVVEKKDEDDSDFDRDDEEFLNDPDLDLIRQKRLEELKQEYSQPTFGDYRHIREDEFLPLCTQKGVDSIVHFWHREFQRCQIMERHLKAIAEKHPRLQVLWIDAEKAPFFVTKLKVRTLPSLLLFREGETIARLTGFENLASPNQPDDFPTLRLEQWLSQHTSSVKLPGRDEGEARRVGIRRV